jgi:hypothetical protein
MVERMTIDDLPSAALDRYMNFRLEFAQLSDNLVSGNAKIEYETIEDTGSMDGSEYALVVYKVGSQQGEGRILFVMSAVHSQTPSEVSWVLREHQMNYQLHSFELRGSGGHGHSH